jgi:ParB/RepB/Spo0J family partition protein
VVDEDDMHLAEDIARRGVRKPLKVRLDKRDNRLKLVDGERRLRNTIRAINLGLEGSENLTEVPVVMVAAGKSDLDLIAEQFSENTDDLRKDFTETQAANGIQRFVDHEMTAAQIVAKTGLKLARVRRLMAILELPIEVATLVRKGTVSATLALEVVNSTKTTEEAVEALTKGLDEAAKSGRTKVMKKHVARTKALPGAATPRTLLKSVAEDFRTSEEVEETNDGVTTVAFHFTPEAAARIKAALGL